MRAGNAGLIEIEAYVASPLWGRCGANLAEHQPSDVVRALRLPGLI